MLHVKVYKISSDDSLAKDDPAQSFQTMDKVYVGSQLIPWRECVDREGEKEEGASPQLSFSLKLVHYGGDVPEVEIEGKMSGHMKWLKFGHPDAHYDADGK